MAEFNLAGFIEIQGIHGLDKAVNDLRTKLGATPELAVISKNINQAGTAARKSKGEVAGLNTSIAAAATSAQDFGDKAALALRRFTAFTVAAGTTYGIARAVFGGLKDAAIFERELIKVQQVTNASRDSIGSLQAEIASLGVSLAAPAQELAEVSRVLSQAGLGVTEVSQLLEPIARTRLAATFGDVQDTTEGVVAIMGQFKIPADEIITSLGLINAAAGGYAVESEDLISSIKRTGGAFAVASQGIVEGNEALAQFNALITSVRATTRQAPETIATGLRTVIARLQRPGTIDFLKGFGIDLRDTQGNFIGVYNAIQKIGQALENVNPLSEEYSLITEKIGGTRQYGVVVPLIQQFRQQQEILNYQLERQNSLIKESEVPLQTLAEKFKILQNTWANFSRDVFGSPAFQLLANQALELSTNLVKVLDNISGLIPIIAALGGLRVGAILHKEGVAKVVRDRLLTGHGSSGIIPRRAQGGYIPGYGTGDKQLIASEAGEFVIRKRAAKQLGPEVLHTLNNVDRMKRGGVIPAFKDGGEVDKYARGGKIRAYHGTPSATNFQKFERNMFDYGGYSREGVGVYSTSDYDIAEKYASNFRSIGQVLDLGLNVHPDKLLNFNTKIKDQSQFIKDRINNKDLTGQQFFNSILKQITNKFKNKNIDDRYFKKITSRRLEKIGIQGIRYQHPEEGDARNYNIFDPNNVDIIGRYIIPKLRIDEYQRGGQVKLGLSPIIGGYENLLRKYHNINTSRQQFVKQKDYLNNINEISDEMFRLKENFPGIQSLSNRNLKLILKRGRSFSNKQDNSLYGRYYDYGTNTPKIDLASNLKSGYGPLALGTGEYTVGDDSLLDTFRHEYAHHLSYSDILSSKRSNELVKAVKPYINKKIDKDLYLTPDSYPVTKYAAENYEEFFAESFAAFTHPDYGKRKGSVFNRLPGKIEQIFAEELRPRKFAAGGLIPNIKSEILTTDKKHSLFYKGGRGQQFAININRILSDEQGGKAFVDEVVSASTEPFGLKFPSNDKRQRINLDAIAPQIKQDFQRLGYTGIDYPLEYKQELLDKTSLFNKQERVASRLFSRLLKKHKFAAGGKIPKGFYLPEYNLPLETGRLSPTGSPDVEVRKKYSKFNTDIYGAFRKSQYGNLVEMLNIESRGFGTGTIKDIAPLISRDIQSLTDAGLQVDINKRVPKNIRYLITSLLETKQGYQQDNLELLGKKPEEFAQILRKQDKYKHEVFENLFIPKRRIKRASGGYIPGVGSGDRVPILAEPGEFVIRKKAAQSLGEETLNRLNHVDKLGGGGAIRQKLQTGGIVTDDDTPRFNRGGMIGRKQSRSAYMYGGKIKRYARGGRVPRDLSVENTSEYFNQVSRDFVSAFTKAGGSTAKAAQFINNLTNQFDNLIPVINRIKEATNQIQQRQTIPKERALVPVGIESVYGSGVQIPSLSNISTGEGGESRELRSLKDVQRIATKELKELGVSYTNIAALNKEIAQTSKGLPDAIQRYRGAIQAVAQSRKSELRGGGTTSGPFSGAFIAGTRPANVTGAGRLDNQPLVPQQRLLTDQRPKNLIPVGPAFNPRAIHLPDERPPRPRDEIIGSRVLFPRTPERDALAGRLRKNILANRQAFSAIPGLEGEPIPAGQKIPQRLQTTYQPRTITKTRQRKIGGIEQRVKELDKEIQAQYQKEISELPLVGTVDKQGKPIQGKTRQQQEKRQEKRRQAVERLREIRTAKAADQIQNEIRTQRKTDTLEFSTKEFKELRDKPITEKVNVRRQSQTDLGNLTELATGRKPLTRGLTENQIQGYLNARGPIRPSVDRDERIRDQGEAAVRVLPRAGDRELREFEGLRQQPATRGLRNVALGLDYQNKNRQPRGNYGFITSRGGLQSQGLFRDVASFVKEGGIQETVGAVGQSLKRRFAGFNTYEPREGRSIVGRGLQATQGLAVAAGRRADPLTLGIAAVGAQNFLPKLGAGQVATDTVGGILGGASAGALVGGGAGAVIGGALGGVNAFIDSAHQKERNAAEEKLIETTKKLDDAFSDLSAKGVANLDRLLSQRRQQAQAVTDIDTRSFSERATNAILNNTGFGTGAKFAGAGALVGLGAGAASTYAGLSAGLGLAPNLIGAGVIAPPVVVGAAAGFAGYKGGEAGLIALQNTRQNQYGGYGFSDEQKNLSKFQERGGNTSAIADFIYRSRLDEVQTNRRARLQAEGGADVAAASKARIKELLTKGRGKDITNELLLGSVADRSDLLKSQNRVVRDKRGFLQLSKDGSGEIDTRGALQNARTQILPEIQKQVAEQKRLNETFISLNKAIDNYQNRLNKFAGNIDIFNKAVDTASNDLQNLSNEAAGNFAINLKFDNPFENLENLTDNQIKGAVNNIQGFLNQAPSARGNRTIINPEIVSTAQSIPLLDNFGEVLNKEIAKAYRSGSKLEKSELIPRLLNPDTGVTNAFDGLPNQIRKQLIDMFEEIPEEQLGEVLSGRNVEVFNEIQKIGAPTKQALIAMQEGVIKLSQTLQEASNNIANHSIQFTQGAVRYQEILNQGVNVKRSIDGLPTDSRLIKAQEDLTIKRFTGGTTNPTEIRQTIQSLQDEKRRIEQQIKTNPQQSKQLYDRLTNNTTALANWNNALKKSEGAALSWASAIQQEISEFKQRQQGAQQFIEDEVLGGNQRQNIRSDLAFKLFEQGGLPAAIGAGASPQEVQAGIARQRQRISTFGTPEELEKFNKETAIRLAEQAGGFTRLTPEQRVKQQADVEKQIKREENITAKRAQKNQERVYNPLSREQFAQEGADIQARRQQKIDEINRKRDAKIITDKQAERGITSAENIAANETAALLRRQLPNAGNLTEDEVFKRNRKLFDEQDKRKQQLRDTLQPIAKTGQGLGLANEQDTKNVINLNLDPKVEQLQRDFNTAMATAAEAVNQQGVLLGQQIGQLEAVLQNKFILGVESLKKSVEQLNIPEKIDMNVIHTHNINVNGLPQFELLTDAMKEIAESTVATAISRVTGQPSQSSDLSIRSKRPGFNR